MKIKIKKVIKFSLIGVFGIVVSVIIALSLQGYSVYKSKIDEKPIQETFEQVRNSDDYVDFNQLPLDYVNAVISVEDHRFFYRNGIDVIAVSKALIDNVLNQTVVRGGSTITQQVAKNLYFDMSRVISRKVAEIFFVNDIESKYTKQEIFATYVSIIYFGDGYYGIKDAAKGYLNKEVSELELCECALLAGLPQSPSVYQLSNHSETTYQRYLQVLAAMVEYNHISKSDYDYCRVNIPMG